jgi:tripartite-type tricarboxylate transporter receptor subunit TctC
MKPGRIGAIMGAWLALAAPATGWAQENFPSRPVRIVIPYAPGGVADVFARIIAQNMAAQWNGSIVVESNPAPTVRSQLKKSRDPRRMVTRGCW